MRVTFRTIPLYILLAILIFGCSNANPPCTTIMTSNKKITEVVSSSTQAISPSDSLTPIPTNTKIANNTPTLVPSPAIAPYYTTKQCLSLVLDKNKIPNKSYGTIMIGSFFWPKWIGSDFEQPFLFRAPSQTTQLDTKISLFSSSTMAVSPDKTKIAFINYGLNQDVRLIIIDHNGNQTASINLPQNLQSTYIIGWYDQGIILAKKYGIYSYDESTNYILFDLNSKKQYNLQTSFPHHYPPDYDYHGTDQVYYSPDLSRAIYFAADKTADMTLYYSLWSFTDDKEITKLNVYDYTNDVAWSANSEFAIVKILLFNQMRLVKINRDGKKDTLVIGNVPQYELSPDSNLLAYWLNDKGSDEFSTLYIKNLETKEVTNYCLQTRQPIGMVWSPDSKYLSVSFEYNRSVITTLVDFEEKNIYKIEDVAKPIGWVK